MVSKHVGTCALGAAAPPHLAGLENLFEAPCSPEASADDRSESEDLVHVTCCDAAYYLATEEPIYALCGKNCRQETLYLDVPEGAQVCRLCEARAVVAQERDAGPCVTVCPKLVFGSGE